MSTRRSFRKADKLACQGCCSFFGCICAFMALAYCGICICSWWLLASSSPAYGLVSLNATVGRRWPLQQVLGEKKMARRSCRSGMISDSCGRVTRGFLFGVIVDLPKYIVVSLVCNAISCIDLWTCLCIGYVYVETAGILKFSAAKGRWFFAQIVAIGRNY